MNENDEMNEMNETGLVDCNDDCQEIEWSFWIEGVAVPLIAAFGITGNVFCVFVFTQKSVELKPCFSNILKCLSIFDSLFLLGVTLLYPLPILSETYSNFEPNVTPYILPFTQIALTGSVYSVLAVALERYFTICRPFQYNLGSLLDGCLYILVIVLFSILYNLARFFEYETVVENMYDPSTNSSTEITKLGLTPLRQNPVYTTVCILLNTAVMGIFPIVTLSILNFKIIKKMRKANLVHNRIATNQRRDGAMTALLSGVVVVLILCHTPKTIINMYESYQMLMWGSLKYTPLWGRLVIKLSHLLLTVSSAVNILIYSYKDLKFRCVVSSVFVKMYTTCRDMCCKHQKEGISSIELLELKSAVNPNHHHDVNNITTAPLVSETNINLISHHT
ncbi:FMRFamide receptor isoform X2 [Eurytemora carolleeae]|nr:FMRFamide receptor isoform X2 [Eurytemora carolleeae]XP_023335795.1 FMRFamide receptor isoform X2 [Eurytemora carolleeae]XP_023335797.1 FMRFamide receptor isoform X2 [Eurytemora carolleeae]XP_023335798.1 FMRFamide receptor isoform X2 [Eurytemora carolleeae]XP_023335799.1 FMRFamide receptor isoform X2 [Eurytemora carolleeae]|eukprot:XP_023335794.1 FMRFamide receptor-like isoform X2 [Eurytemora affinis]